MNSESTPHDSLEKRIFSPFARGASLLGVMAMLGGGNAQAATAIGVDTAAGTNWRTAAALGLNGGTKYGADGSIIYGLNDADGKVRNPYDGSYDQTHLPAAITGVTRATSYYLWSGTGNFGWMQDPENGNALTSVPLLAGGTNPGTFTIHRTATGSFRLTILVASGDNANATYTTTVDDGVSATQNAAHTANGLYYHVYDVEAGSGDVTVTVLCSKGYSATGFAFDMVPLPAEIKTFNLPGYGSGVINQTAKTIAMTVPAGTPETSLAPTYTLSSGACVPASGSSQDFTSPVTYTVIDGDTTNIYTSTVTEVDPSTYTWSNSAGNGQWNISSLNWLNGGTSVPWTNYNLAGFGATGVGTVTLTGDISASGINFDVDGYTVVGSSVTFYGAAAELSRREQEILELLAQGYVNKEIGERLSIGVETVRTHLKHIYDKLHVSSRTEAVTKHLGIGLDRMSMG